MKEKIALISLLVAIVAAIAAWLTVPEFRSFLGLREDGISKIDSISLPKNTEPINVNGRLPERNDFKTYNSDFAL